MGDLEPRGFQVAARHAAATLTDIQHAARFFYLQQGKAILSLNDHPRTREWFAGLHTEVVDISYTVGGNDRGHDRRELVIWSWDQAAEPAGLF